MTAPLEQPLVSVIIPAYNTQTYIAESINSVLGQTYKNLEVIVVDDGSTDSTADIAKALAGQDARVKVVCQPNSGQGSARNTGLRLSAGEIIFFLDSDDYFSSEIVAQAVEAMLRQGCDVVVFNGTSFFDDDGVLEPKNDRYFALEEQDAKAAVTGLQILARTGGRFAQPCMKAYRKAFLDANGILFPEG
ncbi:MAG: glycosyltransferase, partial [Oscillospiraceae bacterium]|nr:glycosyltransferase [Oscillospiraceae bacterium]